LLILLKKLLKFLNAASNMEAIQRAGCFVSCYFLELVCGLVTEATFFGANRANEVLPQQLQKPFMVSTGVAKPENLCL
jgi:hypothetical protein